MRAGATSQANGRLVAVVIAAGQATRLRPYSQDGPKALMELVPGVAIIDLILSQLQEVGIEDVVVVARPEHGRAFEEYLDGRARVVIVDGDGFGSLYSLEAALETAGPRPVLLSMSDHIFEVEILRRLVEGYDGTKRILLCLDALPDHRDLREGLRVEVSRDNVRRVGKAIPPRTGVDTGLFVLSPNVHGLVSTLNAEKAGKATLSDLVNYLAAEGSVGYVDVTGKLWMDIDTPHDLLRGRRRYWDILRRSLYKPTDGPVSRWLNRPVSTRLSVFLFKNAPWANPNLITLASFILAVAAAFLFTQAQLWPGAVLVQFASVLDGVDGELARLRGRVTVFGGLLDSLLDRLADISLILALSAALSPSLIHLILTGLAVFGVVLVSYVSQLAERHVDISRLRMAFPWPTRDVRLFSVTLGGLAFQPIVPLIFCAAAPLIFAARVLVTAMRLRNDSVAVTGLPAAKPRSPQPKVVIPEQSGQSHEIRSNLESLFVNLLKAAIALGVLQLISGTVERTLQAIGIYLPAPLDMDLVFDFTRLAILAYFGYRVLLSVKFFADIATDLVVTRLQITQGMYARATTDILSIITVLLAWSVVSPIISKLPGIGSLFRIPVNLAFLGLAILFLYDLVRIMNRELKAVWDAAITHLTNWLSTHLRPRDNGSALKDTEDRP